jgi:hypothetical protein
LEQVLPLVKVAKVTHTFHDLERRNYTTFDALTGLASRLGCPPIFSAGLVEMSSETVPLGQKRASAIREGTINRPVVMAIAFNCSHPVVGGRSRYFLLLLSIVNRHEIGQI